MIKAYLCTIGERTTEVCKWQLERLGFDVVVLDEVEPWCVKYGRFIQMADEDCIRIDADVILNDKIILDIDQIPENILMAQFQYFDFYRNEVGVGNPCFYSKACLDILKTKLGDIDEHRPEASAWRLKEINDFTMTCERVCGMHGFFQDNMTIARAKKNKEDRGQINLYDFALVDKINEMNLCVRF
jgi:hypothetical protein